MIDGKAFIEALNDLEQQKGISKESILLALKEALAKAYMKQLGGGDDAIVRVDIDPEQGMIDMCQVKKVVKEVEDDYLQISLEDAKKVKKDIKEGDDFEIKINTDELSKLTAMTVKNVLRQKLAEAEKDILYETYKDKIGEMIIGVVEKTDDFSAIINIGRTSVYLPKRQRIGNEVFHVGDNVKLYVMDVVSTAKGAQIAVSRACEGFLRRLFEEEIHEIYDGTVSIKAIAREAGERSKIAVIASDPNVDACGACIGPNGTRIQKIVGQLSNGYDKEKIDVINYHELPALFIAESLKPAQVLGVSVDEANKSAIVVVKEDQQRLAIGRKGANARLAVALTGYHIDIKEENEAKELGIVYESLDNLIQKEEEMMRIKEYERYIATLKPTQHDEVMETIKEEKDETKEEKIIDEVKSNEKEIELVKEEKEEVVVPTPTISIKTTKSLAELEKELENSKKTSPAEPAKRKYTKKQEEPVEEKKEEIKPLSPAVDPNSYMQIYTEEELKEFEEEMGDDINDEDIDYDEYDSYYEDDDDKK